jgi:hypothetical protein
MASSKRDLQRSFRQFNQNNRVEWLEVSGAIMGGSDGSLYTSTAGVFKARDTNGQDIDVLANGIPVKFDLHVLVGRSKFSPTLWQIIKSRESYEEPIDGTFIQYHAPQHAWDGPDRVYLNRKQILYLNALVYDGANFLVQIFGGPIRVGNTNVVIANQLLDLLSSKPTSGAIYLNIEVDESGALSLHVDTSKNFGGSTGGTGTMIPIPTNGKAWFATVLLYDGQTTLSDDDIWVPLPIERGDVGSQIYSAATKSSLNDADLFGIYDSISGRLRSVLFSVVKTVLKTYFDTIYSVFTTEDVQDIVGGMVSGNSETGISVTYDDTNGKLDFTVMQTGQYRQFVYEVSGGDINFLTDGAGYPLFNLEDVE